MRRTTLAIGLLALSYQVLFSQKHDRLVPSGYLGSGGPSYSNSFNMNFGNGKIALDTLKRKMEFSLTNTSICDSMGNLMFMANGCWVADKNGNKMVNGDGVGNGITITCPEGARSYQAALALPRPGWSDRYYLFIGVSNNNELYYKKWVNYSEIDMAQNNGLGNVVAKNVKIDTDTIHEGQMTACKHANGRDWWLVLPPKDTSNRYVMILVGPDGPKIHHVQFVGPVDTFQSPLGKSLFQATFSPNGEKYVRSGTWDGTKVFDFDRCTGMLSNCQRISMPFYELSSGSGAAVSANSKFLYLTNNREIFQIDLSSPSYEQSKIRLDSIDGFHVGTSLSFSVSMLHMVTGADGKIYAHDGNSSFVWHIIHRPNEPGKACHFRQHNLSLPQTLMGTCNCWPHSSMWYIGAPNYPHWRLGPIDGSSCDTLGLDNHPLCNWTWDAYDTLNPKQITFTDNSTYDPTNWHWDFGDGTTSQDTSPVHTFPANGIYHVCLTVCNALSCDTLCYDVVVDNLVSSDEPGYGLSEGVKIYPNPANDYLTIQWPKDIQPSEIRVFNALGQFQAQIIGSNSQEVSTSNWPPGMYFIQFRDRNKIFQTEKIIVVH